MLNTFHMLSLSCRSISLFYFLFHSWPESQSTVRPPWRVENADPLFPEVGVRDLKVLPPHGAWVTETMMIRARIGDRGSICRFTNDVGSGTTLHDIVAEA